MLRYIFLLICLPNIANEAFACTNEVARVCGYWTHTSRTETFQNECKMREHGAQLRHTGSCDYPSQKSPVYKAPSKPSK